MDRDDYDRSEDYTDDRTDEDVAEEEADLDRWVLVDAGFYDEAMA